MESNKKVDFLDAFHQMYGERIKQKSSLAQLPIEINTEVELDLSYIKKELVVLANMMDRNK